MSANINDYFNKASSMNGSYPPVATVSAARATGGKVLTCNDLSGWATDTPVHFSIFKLNADGSVDSSTQSDWKGIVVNNTITEMTWIAGAADSGNVSGDRVELNPTIGWVDDLVTGLLKTHNQNGALKDSAVTTNAIATGAVTAGNIADGAVTADKIAKHTITAGKLDDTTVSRLVAIQDSNITRSDITTGELVNGSQIAFYGLDPNLKYVLEYLAGFDIYRIGTDGTTDWRLRVTKDGGATWTELKGTGGTNTLRSSGSGTDCANATARALLCFTGASSIILQIICTNANARMSYGQNGGNALGKLYIVPSNFPTNV